MRHAVIGPGLLAAALAAAPAWAQTAGDPVNGRLLYEDTPNVSTVTNLTGSCTSGCHGNVQNRRTAIGGSAYADISFNLAMTRFTQAVQGVGAMTQFVPLLSAQQGQEARDIAAYIADTPKTTASQLDFTPTAINTATAVQSVDLTSAVAVPTTETLHVLGVAITGAGAARFTRASDMCDQQTLNPGSSCRVSVTFSAPDTAGYQAVLTLSLRQGTSTTTFTRTVALNGAVASAPPPGSGSTDSGGGALSWEWLAGLVLATGLLGYSRFARKAAAPARARRSVRHAR
jgi:cytochrome c553